MMILDLQMPKLNGLEAARSIRQNSSLNKQTPILLISADSCNLSNLDMEQSGIAFCLQKPIDEKLLLLQILRVADKFKPTFINWQQCLQKVSNNAMLAEEFLNKFIEELHKNREEFCLLWLHQNVQGLADAAHKLKGACYFCGVPLLQNKVIHFEKLALTTNRIDELTEAIAELMQSIDAVIDEYNNHYFKKTKEKECL